MANGGKFEKRTRNHKNGCRSVVLTRRKSLQRSIFLSTFRAKMPRKAGLIKTYGRHRFRTVKTAPWVSPDDVFGSPVSKKEKSFETPTNIRKTFLTTCTNLPKSQWNIPKHKTSPNEDKENAPINEQNKEWKMISNISAKNSHFTPTILEPKHSSAGFSSSSPSTSSPDLSIDEESYIILQRRRKQMSNKLESVIPETPELITANNKNLSGKSTSYFYQNCDLSANGLSNSSIKSVENSFSKNESISPLYPSFGSDISSAEQPLRALQTINRLSYGPSCSTSTPIIRADSRNSQIVTMRGQNKEKYSSSSQSSSFSDCRIFVQPMKLTPEQYQAARLSLGDKNTSRSSPLTIHVHSSKESPQSDLSKKSIESNLENEIQERKKNPRISSSSTGNTDGMVRDCVVSLEKLRLSPLIGQEGRKRSSTFRVSGNSSYASGSSDDMSIPSTPPRKQASHMSFVEALTPMKISPSTRELSAYQKLLLECEQEVPMKFTEYLKPSLMKKCVKIGEGVYGEVFKTINKYKQGVALKIIPINGDFEVNGEPQKSSEEILPEIIISKELSALKYSEELQENSAPNFIDVNRVSLVQDKYPAHLIHEWTKWDKSNQSENDKPDIFPSDQCFLVFEFANGGQDLEHFEFNSYSEAISVLQQITLSLAVAESSLEFEHRDLHWGNVLIIRNDEQEINYHLNGQAMQIDSYGVHVSIIDFTLSRLKKDGVTVFCNLSEDESLFTGKGDYQFEIYRQMRKINEDDWEKFTPATNVQWLHYITDKIRKKKYSSRDRKMMAWLRSFFNQVQDCHSAQEVVYSDFFQM